MQKMDKILPNIMQLIGYYLLLLCVCVCGTFFPSGAAGQLDMVLPSLTSLFQPTPQSRLFCFELDPAFPRKLNQIRFWRKNL